MPRDYISWPEIQRVSALLLAEKGNHEEEGQNKGTCIKYQLVTGNGPGDSWCLSFIYWGLQTILGRLRTQRIMFGVVTGACEQLRRAAMAAGAIVGEADAVNGDIGLVVDRAADHAHHAFWIDSTSGENNERVTIEGNSNDTGGSNGDGTYVRDKRFGPTDSARRGGGGRNRYEVVRIQKLEST